MLRWVILGIVVIGVGVGACTLLLPERFAVNAPIAHTLFGRGTDAPGEPTIRERLKVPDGFALSKYAEGIQGARWLLPTPAGDFLVSAPRHGKIVLVERDRDGDGLSDGHRDLLTELDRPHGMELVEDWLYVAEADGFGRIRFEVDGPEGARVIGDFEKLVDDLPAGGNHWTRTIRLGPDGWLYVNVGSSCNVCEEEDPRRRAAMLRFRLDGSGEETVATGLRNSAGFDWRPETGALYATENGRDLLGDDFPPCELNRIEPGGFYGWPYANGNRVPDPDLGKGREAEIARSIPPVFDFRAHNAPLGITFLRGASLPDGWRGVALVALHGSWNRTRKDGYKVISLHWDDAADDDIRARDFLTGFELDDDVIGRPVDVAEGADGAIYVSDDFAGVIWRVHATSASEPSGS
jgi:glucose/arabinose dehydrogenase